MHYPKMLQVPKAQVQVQVQVLETTVKYNLSTPVLEHFKCQTESKPLVTQNVSIYS